MDLSGARLSRRGLLAAAALAASGCTVSAPGPSASVSPSPTPVEPSGVNGHAADRLAQGGTVRLPLGDIPAQWNPWHADGHTGDARALRAPLSAPAFTIDAAGVARPNPDFVASATASGTPTVATLRLNPLAVWGDGASITAADWVATWKAVGAGDRRFNVRTLPGWARVGEVRRGADDHEVIVTFASAVADWTRPLVDGPARASSVADPETFNRGWSTYHQGWFAGPFVLVHLDRLQGVVTLGPNPLWWGAQPRLDSVVFRTVRPDATAASFAAGEFDLWTPPDEGALRLAKTAPDSAIRTVAGTTGRVLTLATTGALADVKLRQAIVRGIDRATLTTKALAGSGADTPPWSHHLLLPQQAGYSNVADAVGLGFDAAAAGQALSNAGWPLVNGLRRGPAGPLSLTFTVPPGDTRAVAEAALVGANLAALGVQVTTVTTGGDLTPSDLAVPRYPLIQLTSHYADVPGFASFATAIVTTVDADARAEQVTQASRLLWQDARTVPLYVQPDLAVVRSRLSNLGASGLATVAWEDVGWAR